MKLKTLHETWEDEQAAEVAELLQKYLESHGGKNRHNRRTRWSHPRYRR